MNIKEFRELNQSMVNMIGSKFTRESNKKISQTSSSTTTTAERTKMEKVYFVLSSSSSIYYLKRLPFIFLSHSCFHCRKKFLLSSLRGRKQNK